LASLGAWCVPSVGSTRGGLACISILRAVPLSPQRAAKDENEDAAIVLVSALSRLGSVPPAFLWPGASMSCLFLCLEPVFGFGVSDSRCGNLSQRRSDIGPIALVTLDLPPGFHDPAEL
ncbi:hypothetical protein CEP53_012278, partial [Fusarium sp. AF-6]